MNWVHHISFHILNQLFKLALIQKEHHLFHLRLGISLPSRSTLQTCRHLPISLDSDYNHTLIEVGLAKFIAHSYIFQKQTCQLYLSFLSTIQFQRHFWLPAERIWETGTVGSPEMKPDVFSFRSLFSQSSRLACQFLRYKSTCSGRWILILSV